MSTLPAPETIGRYQILGELGKGAMGVVYKALDPTIGRTVALKTMRVDVHGIEAEEMLARFRNEARAAGVLNHRNIVTVFDAGEQGGHFYMALEVIEGQTLQQMIQKERVLSVEFVVEMARQVCAGLDYAHDHGIIHRDIKPANIMITADGTAKIMDFGIAKGAATGLTSTGQVMGTPNYMAPEQVKGRPLDGRSDLFSLGVVLYEVITGEKPFAGQNVTTIIYKIVNENPIAPRELDVTIHPGLSAVIMKALAKNPDERYQRGADVARDLQNYKSVGGDSEVTLRMPMTASAGTAVAAAAAPAPTPADVKTPSGPMAIATYGEPTPAPAAFPQAPALAKRILVIAAALFVVLAVAGGLLYRWRRAHQPPAPASSAQPAQLPAKDSSAPLAPTVAENPSNADANSATPAVSVPASNGRHSAKSAGPPAAAASAPATPSNAPPATGTAQLSVNSVPAGARVQIDGRSAPGWQTPVTISDVAPGAHSVILSKDGYLPESRVIDLAEGRRGNINIAFNPVGGILALNSTPAGAKVLVDGRDTGKVTPARISVSRGAHSVALQLDGYKPANTSTTLNPGDTYNYAPVLERDKSAAQEVASPFKKLFGGGIPQGKGQVEVRSKPKGAQIFVNGKKHDKPTPAKINLDPATYTIELRMDGYKPVKTPVSVAAGKSARIEPTLEKR